MLPKHSRHTMGRESPRKTCILNTPMGCRMSSGLNLLVSFVTAVRSIRLGSPRGLRSGIGPIISEEARAAHAGDSFLQTVLAQDQPIGKRRAAGQEGKPVG